MNIGYKGEVNLTIVRKGKKNKTIKVNNSGTTYLFTQLALAMADQPYQIPNYVDVVKEQVNEQSGQQVVTYPSVLLTPSPITRRVVRQDAISTRYTASIQARQFKEISSNKVEINRLALRGDSGANSLMAVIKLDSPIVLLQGQVLIVEWVITFSNQDSSNQDSQETPTTTTQQEEDN